MIGVKLRTRLFEGLQAYYGGCGLTSTQTEDGFDDFRLRNPRDALHPAFAPDSGTSCALAPSGRQSLRDSVLFAKSWRMVEQASTSMANTFSSIVAQGIQRRRMVLPVVTC
jgi:hypothetical protein